MTLPTGMGSPGTMSSGSTGRPTAGANKSCPAGKGMTVTSMTCSTIGPPSPVVSCTSSRSCQCRGCPFSGSACEKRSPRRCASSQRTSSIHSVSDPAKLAAHAGIINSVATAVFSPGGATNSSSARASCRDQVWVRSSVSAVKWRVRAAWMRPGCRELLMAEICRGMRSPGAKPRRRLMTSRCSCPALYAMDGSSPQQPRDALLVLLP
mmetsp:Transcript_35458/g.89409  ORF Transcript_35458/g.89409 Transcript_35458/m.89409 type:complete len:208 (+) Transcript_35458:385-1008(+)